MVFPGARSAITGAMRSVKSGLLAAYKDDSSAMPAAVKRKSLRVLSYSMAEVAYPAATQLPAFVTIPSEL
jgi:hypothetical protein